MKAHYKRHCLKLDLLQLNQGKQHPRIRQRKINLIKKDKKIGEIAKINVASKKEIKVENAISLTIAGKPSPNPATNFEIAFLSYLLLPTGYTMGQSSKFGNCANFDYKFKHK
jgi:hypothetical protein